MTWPRNEQDKAFQDIKRCKCLWKRYQDLYWDCNELGVKFMNRHFEDVEKLYKKEIKAMRDYLCLEDKND